MFDIADTPFSYGRELIICSSLQKFSKTKESALHMICNVDYFVGQSCGLELDKNISCPLLNFTILGLLFTTYYCMQIVVTCTVDKLTCWKKQQTNNHWP